MLDDEASQVCASGLIVRDVPRRPSNWRSQIALPEWLAAREVVAIADLDTRRLTRSEEHTSELQSLMRSSYAGFCWKKKKAINVQIGGLHTNNSRHQHNNETTTLTRNASK